MKCILLVASAALAAACSNDQKSTVSPRATAQAQEAGRALPDSALDASSAEGQEGDLPAGALRDEGTARPPRASREEPVLQRPSFPPPARGQMAKIPGGTLKVGSRPEDVLRVQWAEMDMVSKTITPFEMDVLPYPNDPGQPFAFAATRAEAETQCGQQGKRLCSELEWEWACKSGDERRYPSGNQYDPLLYGAAAPLEPVSPFGVFAMGRVLEWTKSAWGTEPDQVERAVARGYAADPAITPQRGQRCAMRWRLLPEGASEVGFRCCRGEANKAVVEIEPTRPPLSPYANMKPEKFAALIRSIPELKAVQDSPRMFSDADIRTVLMRRGTDREALAKQGTHFVWKPMRWIPRQGTELWVAVGRSNRHSFIVALHEVLDNEKYVHASSLVLWNQPMALALAYKEGHREELFWAPCWDCRDGGTLTFDDAKNEIIITHKW